MLKFELIFSLEVEFKFLVLPLAVSRHGTTDPQKRSDFFSSFLNKKPTHWFFTSVLDFPSFLRISDSMSSVLTDFLHIHVLMVS